MSLWSPVLKSGLATPSFSSTSVDPVSGIRSWSIGTVSMSFALVRRTGLLAIYLFIPHGKLNFL